MVSVVEPSPLPAFPALPFKTSFSTFSHSFSTCLVLNLEAIRAYCLNKPGNVTEDFPFDEEVLVFRLFGRIFLLTSINQRPLALNLKCDPEQAIEWREQYESVRPGYHMNKKHWNTITIDGSVPQRELLKMIDHSYEQVLRGLKKSDRLKAEQARAKTKKTS